MSKERDEFKKAVLARDKGCCVICSGKAVDAHHIMERKLFPDGGYVPDNGASVCDPCHVLCEQTLVGVHEVRAKAGIAAIVLPPGFRPDQSLDKWGNELLEGGLRIAGPLAHDDGCRRALSSARLDGTVVRDDGLPLPRWVGYSARTPQAWADWRLMVHDLAEATKPGGPMEGWLFHGTSSSRGQAIMEDGMEPTEVLRRDEDGQYLSQGSFWGTALTAAWYAEDTLLNRADGTEWPVIVAVHPSSLDDEGELVADEATLDFPDLLIRELGEDEVDARLGRIGPSPGWRECLEAAWAVALIHSHVVPSDGMLCMGTPSEVAATIGMERRPPADGNPSPSNHRGA